jgi:hypothetical protein
MSLISGGVISAAAAIAVSVLLARSRDLRVRDYLQAGLLKTAS